MATYNVHAGHCPQGKGASGACGYLKESVEDRLVKDTLITKLRAAGHTVYDCTDDSNCSASQNLKNIVTKCNAHSVDLDISIHLNAGGGTGVETLIYDNKTKDVATRISSQVSSALGITNRGVKTRTGLYVLKHTISPALLVECCFVDSQNDYNKWNVEKCAEAIFKGITGASSAKAEWVKNETGWWYKHADGSYATNNWEKINGVWYYFDGNGYMVTGWQKIGDYWYYMDESGAMQTGWQNINDNWYYLKSDGAMANNEWYKDENGNWYWLKEGGYMAHDEIVWIGKEMFYFMSDGHLAHTNDRGALQ